MTQYGYDAGAHIQALERIPYSFSNGIIFQNKAPTIGISQRKQRQ